MAEQALFSEDVRIHNGKEQVFLNLSEPIFFFLEGAPPWAMEIPRLGGESEL